MFILPLDKQEEYLHPIASKMGVISVSLENLCDQLIMGKPKAQVSQSFDALYVQTEIYLDTLVLCRKTNGCAHLKGLHKILEKLSDFKNALTHLPLNESALQLTGELKSWYEHLCYGLSKNCIFCIKAHNISGHC